MFLYKFISIKYAKQAHWIYDVYGSEDLWKSESHSVVSDSETPWTMQSMEFSSPEYWSG